GCPPYAPLCVGLWWGVLSGCFGCVGFFFGRIFGIGGMFRWSIDGVEHQWFVAGITEIVLRSRGHGALVSGLDRMGFAAEVGFTGSRAKGQDLVGMLVDYINEYSADRDGHDHNLSVFPGPQRFAEMRIVLGDVGDGEMFDIAFNGKMFLGHNFSFSFSEMGT